MHNYSKAAVILNQYRYYFPKSIDDQLTAPKLSIASNHPAVIPENQDKPILREMDASDYCHKVRFIINLIRPFGWYSVILNYEYIRLKPTNNSRMAIRMGISRRTFYRKWHHAIKLFAKFGHERSCVENNKTVNLLNYLYIIANKK